MPRQVDETHACRKFACRFQACLKNVGFQNMDQCAQEVRDLKQCCRKFNQVSVHCAFPELDEVDDEGKPVRTDSGGDGRQGKDSARSRPQ